MPNTLLAADDETIPVFTSNLGSWRFSVQRRPWTSDQLSAHYDRAAAMWDRTVTRLGFPRFYRSVFEQLRARCALGSPAAPAAQPVAHLRALDCGIGTGTLSEGFLTAFSDVSVNLQGLDISSEMLEHAGRKLERLQRTPECGGRKLTLSLHQGDVRTLPFPSDSFDVVMTAHTLEHLPTPVPVLREMIRVLRPGGLMIAVMTRRSTLGLYIQMLWRTHAVPPHRAVAWLEASGLTRIFRPKMRGSTLCRAMSFAVVGEKPMVESASHHNISGQLSSPTPHEPQRMIP